MVSNEPWPFIMDDDGGDDSKQGEEKDKKKEKEDQKECFYPKAHTFIALTKFMQCFKCFIHFNLFNPLSNPLR